MEKQKVELKVKDNLIGIMKVNGVDYISLTDLAHYKNPEFPNDVIKKWMSNKNAFDFYSLWEQLFNKEFNSAEFSRIKSDEVGYNCFTMTPRQWVKRTKAIGIIAGGGRYSKGTFAHPDIALEFASWIDTSFKLYLIKEFERLKTREAYQERIEWDVRRSLSKTNYRIHTDSIKENIYPTLTDEQRKFCYSNEADVLNVALFGKTAKGWKKEHPDAKGNIRDYTSILQLVVLSNLEVINAEMIRQGISQQERLDVLNKTAIRQLEILWNDNNLKKIENNKNNEKMIYK